MEAFGGRVRVLVSLGHSAQHWARFVFTTVQMERLRPRKGRDLPSESAAGPRPALFTNLSRGGHKVRMALWSPDSVSSGSLESWGVDTLQIEGL